MATRLPASLEVSALIRAVQAEGGFATVLAKGEPDAGTIALVLLDHGGRARLYERMPTPDGDRAWTCTLEQEQLTNQEFNDIIDRRRQRDPDLWIVELDIPQAERFVVEPIARG
ncbi:MAG: DUF1491 family protein [Sphingomonadales bacterium]|nr:DUF1491 family protein [Sphingomonadales bacterium]